MERNSTQAATPRRNSTTRAELGLYMPRRYNPVTRERFLRDRRRRYLARVLTAAPSDTQASLIQTLAALEWAALASEHEGGVPGMREAREHRRLLMRLLGDFEKSLIVQPRKLTPQEAVAAIHEQMRQHRDEAA